MEIKVIDIPVEGLKVNLKPNPSEIEGLGEDITVLAINRAEFDLKKVGATVYIAGATDIVVELPCSRCGKRFHSKAASSFSLDMNPLERLGEEEEKGLSPDDLNVEFYRGGVIELMELLRQQILLLAPMKPLCSEDCRGLCQYCGQDKNERECGCEPPAGHPGLAGLKDLLK
ncbi:MAG: DUF177 domain-containing protein [Nitrospirota bacterium]